MSIKGFNNQKGLGYAKHVTVQSGGSDKNGIPAACIGVYEVFAAAAMSSVTQSSDGKQLTVAFAAPHSARIGDFLRLTNGTLIGWEYEIVEIPSASSVLIWNTASSLPIATELAEILRPIIQRFNSDGSTIVTINPAGLATEAKQDTQITEAQSTNTKLDTIIAKDFATSAKQDTGNTSLGNIDTKTPALVGGRVPVDGSGVTQPVSGPLTDAELRASAVPVSAAALPLPSGAATEATLASLDGKVPANLTVSATRLLVDGSGVTQPISAAALPLPSGASTEATLSSVDGKLPATLGQKAMAASLAVVIASDQSALPVSESIRTGSFQEDLALSTVVTFTAPANSKWFMIQADDTNSANIRWKVGGTATTSSGHQLQPGRSEQMELGGNVSVVSESGTQKVAISFGV